ncbi:hypothetical protein FSP39_006119 [Pinctada imbricata]|uniref:C1q domain-containing protein n=1 Tax=Pinctada imbricata TaxID=66713 RepID=A0AA88YS45_PINIB|nr:hypothetical protein FSP39_006119 [Pinctada imbricata]
MSVPMKNVGEKHSLAFDVVMANEGNAFHSSTGVFMVPESGLYVFTWSFRLTSGSYHSVELAVNGQSAGVIFSAPTGGAQSGTSATIVIHATKGDDIYLRTKENNVGDIFSNGYGHTSFAGWKLFQ